MAAESAELLWPVCHPSRLDTMKPCGAYVRHNKYSLHESVNEHGNTCCSPSHEYFLFSFGMEDSENVKRPF